MTADVTVSLTFLERQVLDGLNRGIPMGKLAQQLGLDWAAIDGARMRALARPGVMAMVYLRHLARLQTTSMPIALETLEAVMQDPTAPHVAQVAAARVVLDAARLTGSHRFVPEEFTQHEGGKAPPMSAAEMARRADELEQRIAALVDATRTVIDVEPDGTLTGSAVTMQPEPEEPARDPGAFVAGPEQWGRQGESTAPEGGRGARKRRRDAAAAAALQDAAKAATAAAEALASLHAMQDAGPASSHSYAMRDAAAAAALRDREMRDHMMRDAGPEGSRDAVRDSSVPRETQVAPQRAAAMAVEW